MAKSNPFKWRHYQGEVRVRPFISLLIFCNTTHKTTLSPQGRHTGSHSYRLYRLRPTAAAASKSAIRSSCEP
jgi:hypothetical protein